ncbi:MAG: T9SS type A sorting domain-containing protein, partial [Dinghuibacter sp.]|nr:T9SS type A sorting domain-containing protein [Dinghuibacter sp.]
AGLNSYFAWTSADNSGQLQITGDLVNELPASVTYVNVAFRVKASVLGKSTITANFLITNHSSGAILSDENGSNNVASLAYQVARNASPVAAGEATQPYLYPNPVVDVKKVMIETKQGEFKGTYAITITDAAGKLIQSGTVVLDGVQRFAYAIGNVAAGKYVLQLRKSGSEKVFVIKFEKL